MFTPAPCAQEIVWLGDIPVASIRNNTSGTGVGVFYIHTDHLNAPTKMTEPTTNTIVWRWDHDPFGNGAPNEDPDGNGLLVTMNLRFPGQYFDSEAGLHYNYFRDYDPQTGRYVQSDPIGLDGGSMSTYAYVNDDPVNFIDPEGLMGNGTRRKVRDCTTDEWKQCETQCGSKGVRSCKRQQLFMPVRTVNRSGLVISKWIWKDQRLSCDCNEPTECGGGCKGAIVIIAVGIGICTLNPELIPVILLGSGAAAAAR